MEKRNRQEGPWPEELESLIKRMRYKKGWVVYITEKERGQGCSGLTLNIVMEEADSYSEKRIRVWHLMAIPAAAYNEKTWRRWLFEQILLVERHEAAEFFEIDGKKPYAPHHLDGWDVYTIFEPGTDEEEARLRR